jgi:hypothetical protein
LVGRVVWYFSTLLVPPGLFHHEDRE